MSAPFKSRLCFSFSGSTGSSGVSGSSSSLLPSFFGVSEGLVSFFEGVTGASGVGSGSGFGVGSGIGSGYGAGSGSGVT